MVRSPPLYIYIYPRVRYVYVYVYAYVFVRIYVSVCVCVFACVSFECVCVCVRARACKVLTRARMLQLEGTSLGELLTWEAIVIGVTAGYPMFEGRGNSH